MTDVYLKCDSRGISRSYADSFYYRVTESPLKHAQNIIDNSKNKYSNKAAISRLISFLEVMLEVMPNHTKKEELEKAIALLSE